MLDLIEFKKKVANLYVEMPKEKHQYHDTLLAVIYNKDRAEKVLLDVLLNRALAKEGQEIKKYATAEKMLTGAIKHLIFIKQSINSLIKVGNISEPPQEKEWVAGDDEELEIEDELITQGERKWDSI